MTNGLVYLALASLEAVVEGTCDQIKLLSDCADAQGDLNLRERTSLIIGFVVCIFLFLALEILCR